MSISETRKAIRGIASNYGEDRIWASTQVCTFADLKELEAAYTQLADVLEQIVWKMNNDERHVYPDPCQVCEYNDLVYAVVEKIREDPERVELAPAPSGGELSGR